MADDPIIELAKLQYATQIDDMAERVKIQASIADRALQSLMLANGGALVALFTLVGKAGAVHFDVRRLKIAFACFVAGLIMALIAHLFAFLSQDRFLHSAFHEADRHASTILTGTVQTGQAEALAAHRVGMRHYAIGIGVFVFSIVGFVAGCLIALLAVV